MKLLVCFTFVIYLIPAQNSNSDSYFCPPCGCNGDSIVFVESGICTDEDCSMLLLSGNWQSYERRLGEIDFVANEYFQQFYNLIIYPAIIQGFILVTLLLTSFRQKRRANTFLAVMVFAITVQNLSYYFFEINLEQDSNFVYLFFPLSYILLIGPALYQYTKNLLNPNQKLVFHQYIYFIPALISITFNLLLFFNNGQVKHKLIHSATVLTFSLVEQLLSIIFIIYFSIRSIKLLKQYNHWLKNKYSEISQLNLNWLHQLIKAFISIAILWLLIISLGWYVTENIVYDFKFFKQNYYLLWIAFSFLIYWLAYTSIVKSKLLIEEIDLSEDFYTISKENDKNLDKLLTGMTTNKLYLDQDLTLDKLSEQLKIDSKVISSILNQQLNKNFFTFINEYRVADCKLRLLDKKI